MNLSMKLWQLGIIKKRRRNNVKANLDQLFKKNRKGKLRPTWRYYLARIFGSVGGYELSDEDYNGLK